MPFLPALDKSQARTALLTPAPRASQEPIRDTDQRSGPVPMLAFFSMLNDVVENAPFLVKLKLEEASKLLVRSLGSGDNVCNLFDHVADLSTFLLARLAARLPFDDELLVAHIA